MATLFQEPEGSYSKVAGQDKDLSILYGVLLQNAGDVLSRRTFFQTSCNVSTKKKKDSENAGSKPNDHQVTIKKKQCLKACNMDPLARWKLEGSQKS